MPQFLLGRHDPYAEAVEIAALCYLVEMQSYTTTPLGKAGLAGVSWIAYMMLVKQFQPAISGSV